MVEDGLFERFPRDAICGLHNMPGLAVDEMAVVEGPQLASSDSWRLTFRGVGTHGAKPHLGKDPISAAASFLALNVIPDMAEIGGAARAYSSEVRDQLEAEIGRLAHGAAAMSGISAEYQFERRIPPVVNDPNATARALKAARAAFANAC